MTLVFGSSLFLFGLLLTLIITILKTDGSYLISSATRPPRLKYHVGNEKYAENGTPGGVKGDNLYRQSPGHNLIENENFNKKLWALGKSSHHFFNTLQPAAKNFLLQHERYPGVARNKRHPFGDDFSDEDSDEPSLSDLEHNDVIEQNPKSSKNLNYYPYREKRPFEVPQIGKCIFGIFN